MTSETTPHPNGTPLRVRPRIGPQDALTPSGPGKHDDRGIVPDSERERLAAGFGAELSRIRKASALSQARLGDLAGLRGDHVGRLERGQRRPTVAGILALSRILVPAGEREAVERRLAALAGYSLRDSGERKKQARDHRDRRLALAATEKANRTMLNTIRAQEARGEIAPGNLRRMAEKTAAMLARLKAEVPAEPAGIRGYAPAAARPVSRRKEDILAWIAARPGPADPNNTNR